MQSIQPRLDDNSPSPTTPPAPSLTPAASAGALDHHHTYPSMDNFRRRAVSEVVRQSSSKWKIVAAFNSLRKSWDKHDDTTPDSHIHVHNNDGHPDLENDNGDDKEEATSGRSMGASDMDSGSFQKLAPRPSADQTRSSDTNTNTSADANAIPTYALPASERASTSSNASRPPSSAAGADASAGAEGGGTKVRPRKRVSLFLRRRGRFRGGNVPHSVNAVLRADNSTTDSVSESTQHFRRAQSHFVKPVSLHNSEGVGGATRVVNNNSESGRYMEYAADFDFTRTINSLRKLRPAAIRIAPTNNNNNNASTNNNSLSSTDAKNNTPGSLQLQPMDGNEGDESVVAGASRPISASTGPVVTATTMSAVGTGEDEHSDDDIIGEICLEDFADTGSEEDFSFLDGQIVDVWSDDEDGDGDSNSERVPTLRLDGQKISLFGEEEFAAFCKELLKPPKPSAKDLESFTIDEQWRDDTRIHNRFAAHWDHKNRQPNDNDNNIPPEEDIRSLSYNYAYN